MSDSGRNWEGRIGTMVFLVIIVTVLGTTFWLGGQQTVNWHDTGVVTSVGKTISYNDHYQTFDTSYNGTITTQSHGSFNFGSSYSCPWYDSCIPYSVPVSDWTVGMKFGVLHHAGGYITLVKI